MQDMEAETEDVLDWFLDLSPDERRKVLRSPVDLSTRRLEKRAELEEWIDRVTVDDDVGVAASLLVKRGFDEDEAEQVVDEIVGPDDALAEGVVDDRSRLFEKVGREVLASYTDRETETETETGSEQDVSSEDVAELRLLLSRTVVAVSCGDLDLDGARRRLEVSGASDDAVDGFLDDLESDLDEVDLHLRRIKLDRLSEDIRSLRWDSLGR